MCSNFEIVEREIPPKGIEEFAGFKRDKQGLRKKLST
jgi:hypothetical protein